ncbi:hypothetical protein ACIRSS_15760 [Amycolatopsis sp. NPDC101161]|uniref:hypothetical protein n=1 Tax=Amycolatopsis sp. NPDC101161 TaxID=3363940 RepID=UPI003801BD47
MQRQATWRALAATYAVIAGMQVYLAISMNAAWAWALGVVFALAAVGSGFAAWRARRPPAVTDLPELASPVMALARETRNTVNFSSDLRSRH